MNPNEDNKNASAAEAEQEKSSRKEVRLGDLDPKGADKVSGGGGLGSTPYVPPAPLPHP